MSGTLTDNIKSILSDGKPRTSRQIVKELYPDKTESEQIVIAVSVTSRLCNLRRWGVVESTRRVKGETGRGWAIVWRLTQ